MNARIAKLALAVCSLCLLNFTGLVQAQDTTPEDAAPTSTNTNGRAMRPPGYRGAEASLGSLPEFDIQIENGKLSLAIFKETTGKNPWPNATSVPATIENLSKYLRAIDPNLNIVLSPDVGHVTIQNLKLNSHNPFSISQAVSVASGGAIIGPEGGSMGFGGGLRGMERNLTFIANRPRPAKPAVEVFNLSGYIQTLGTADDDIVRQKIDDLRKLTQSTLVDDMKMSPDDQPNFKYHPGTKLLIVVGKPEAIDLARKIINALPGQPKYFKGISEDVLDVAPPSDQK